MKYDYAIIGSGLSGAVMARELQEAGKSVILFERRNHVGGNLYCEDCGGILVHNYGAHIFHTNDKPIWDYVNRFVTMNGFVNSPIANYKGELYNLPFNMNTFYQLFGAKTPKEAEKAIRQDCVPCENPTNLEDYILSVAGRTVYEKLIKGYTEKQWGRPCKELPKEIIKRVPFRFLFDNSYFRDRWQGVPEEGYNALIVRLIGSAPVILGVDYNKNRNEVNKMANRIIYTGSIDELFDCEFGKLEYRSLKFEHNVYQSNNLQGVAVMNYTDGYTPFTRKIEHKHFAFGDEFVQNLPFTVVSNEYPVEYNGANEPYYPIETQKNDNLYKKYKERADEEGRYILIGRLAEYKYYDMKDAVESSLNVAEKLLRGENYGGK